MNVTNVAPRGTTATPYRADDRARRASAVLDQMYAYFSWDDLPFTQRETELQDYPLVA